LKSQTTHKAASPGLIEGKFQAIRRDLCIKHQRWNFNLDGALRGQLNLNLATLFLKRSEDIKEEYAEAMVNFLRLFAHQ